MFRYFEKCCIVEMVSSGDDETRGGHFSTDSSCFDLYDANQRKH